jgi:hypothetical protein
MIRCSSWSSPIASSSSSSGIDGKNSGSPLRQDLWHSRRRVGVGRVPVLELVGPAHLLGILVCHREPLDLARRPDHVDRAPVGEPGNAELRDLRERVVVVERGREYLARLGQEGHPLAQVLLGRVEARAGERLGGLARERQLHLAALLAELEVAVEGKGHRAEDTALDCERDDSERVPVLSLVRERRVALVALLHRHEEDRLAGPNHLRHRHVGLQREARPAGHRRGVVAPLGEQLDAGAVHAEHADRAGAGLGCLDPFGQDRVEHLLGRDRLRQELATR